MFGLPENSKVCSGREMYTKQKKKTFGDGRETVTSECLWLQTVPRGWSK
jgi:hypothetical protein